MLNTHPLSIPPLSRQISLIAISLLLISCSSPETDHTHTAASDTEETHHDDNDTHHDEEHSDAHKRKESRSTVRSADSHVHGGATLSIAAENSEISIEFESPIYNLLGFEYAPKSEAEKTLVEEVEAKLAQPETLIIFNTKAKCSFPKTDQDTELFHHEADEPHDDEDHHDDDHHDDDHSETHKDVILTYAATCQNIEKLESVKVGFFESFPNFKDLDLVYLGPSKQMSADLTPSRATADLTR